MSQSQQSRIALLLLGFVAAVLTLTFSVIDVLGETSTCRPETDVARVQNEWISGVQTASGEVFINDHAYWLQGAQEPWSGRFIGQNDYEMEVRPGEKADFDAPRGKVERSQLSSQTKMDHDTVYRVRTGITVDHPSGRSRAIFLNIFGLHQTADAHDTTTIGGTGIPGLFRLTLRPNGTLEAIKYESHQDPLVDESPVATVVYAEPFLYGVRHDLYAEIRPHRSDGYLRLWLAPNFTGAVRNIDQIKAASLGGVKGGEPIANYSGPVAYPDRIGPYVQLQVYRAAGDPDIVSVTFSDPTVDWDETSESQALN